MTELIWDGKYDKDGRRVASRRIALPFWTVETVNLRPGVTIIAAALFTRLLDQQG